MVGLTQFCAFCGFGQVCNNSTCVIMVPYGTVLPPKKKSSALHLCILSSPLTPGNNDLFTVFLVWPCLECHTVGISRTDPELDQQVLCWDWRRKPWMNPLCFGQKKKGPKVRRDTGAAKRPE